MRGRDGWGSWEPGTDRNADAIGEGGCILPLLASYFAPARRHAAEMNAEGARAEGGESGTKAEGPRQRSYGQQSSEEDRGPQEHPQPGQVRDDAEHGVTLLSGPDMLLSIKDSREQAAT